MELALTFAGPVALERLRRRQWQERSRHWLAGVLWAVAVVVSARLLIGFGGGPFRVSPSRAGDVASVRLGGTVPTSLKIAMPTAGRAGLPDRAFILPIFGPAMLFDGVGGFAGGVGRSGVFDGVGGWGELRFATPPRPDSGWVAGGPDLPRVPAAPGVGRKFRVTVTSRSRSARPSPARSETAWHWPVRGRISSGFGARVHPVTRRRGFHAAIDIIASPGAPVLAATIGTVVRVGWMGALGRVVRVESGDDVLTYGHLSSINCRVGQRLRAGQMLGRVGATGRCTGAHLHFSIRRGGRSIDPLALLWRR